MVTETSSSVPVPEKVERSFHLASTPIETPNVDGGYFITDLEADLHDENKNLHGILGKLTQYLVACHPDAQPNSVAPTGALLTSSMT